MDPDRVLEGLDPEQTQAARALRGPVCILAGAGTGKTRAITHRIAHAVAAGVVAEQQVLAVTFTNRAAGEMRGRLRALGAPRVQARTFHAAALRQLAFFWPQVIGGDKPTLIESKLQVVSRAARSTGIQPDRTGLRDLASEIEWAKVTQVRPTDYDKVVAKAGRQSPLPAQEVARVFEAYEELCREHNLLDFESMLELTAGMITEYPAIAQRVRDQYRYFVVDEFQDVNPLQKLLLDAWLGDRDDLCVVGDPSQTIYSFAGATPAYLTGFAASHPHATVVELVRDYRSTPQVVRVANHVISQARGNSSTRALTLQAQRPEGPDPIYQEYDDEPAEATGVARKISVLMESGVSAGEIAVLLRTNSQSAAYEQALTDEGVPFTLRGTTRFFERPEIREAVHLLRGARHGAEEDPVPLGSTVRQLLTPLGLADTAPEGRKARERWESLTALAQLAEDMVAGTGSGEKRVTMAHFVEELEARMATEHAPGFEGVTIASLHAAKGLEWDAVFLVGLTEGMMPIIYAETDEQVEEERRLFYVGVTRAREHLAMSWSLSRSPGGRRTRTPSRFLDGLRPASPSTTTRRNERRRSVARCRVCGSGLTDAAERKLGRCLDCPSNYDEALLERLRDWRRSCAQELKVPAYVIFTDATLQAIAEQEPSSTAQLSAVSGVGAVKLDRYGEAVLALVSGAEPAEATARNGDREDATDE